MNTLRIFVSSPGDVAEERALAERVIDRLQGEDMGRVVLEPIFWEHEPLLATEGFQEQLPRASEADVAVFILWGRLGTRLPENITRLDGSRFASGTEFEFEDAQGAWSETGKPSILTYRKSARLQVDLEDEASLMTRLAQKKALDEFEGRWFASEDKSSLIGAFHPFTNPAEFESLFELHLRALVKRHLPDMPASESGLTAAWQAGSPFRGLETFDFEHARIFAGRTRAVGDILDALRRQAAAGRAFVLVLGMSGGGKSSVVRAGVLPMLTRPGVVEGVGHWRRTVFRPSDTAGDLFDGLERALVREEALPELYPAQAPGEIAELLRTAPQAAAAVVRQTLAMAGAGLEASVHTTIQHETRLALVVDQLEEIFTLERVTAEERKRFLAAIDALARSGSVWVLATIRSDFYPRCAESATLVALKEGVGQYDLQPPTAAEIGQMIRLPTSAAGLTFEGEPATGEHLADLLRDAASQSPGALPQLEFTLEELYKRRTKAGMLTLEAYRGLGGLAGSLARRAEEVFGNLAPEVEAALPRVLNAVVTVAGQGAGTVGRKRAGWESVVTPEAKALVEAFVEARLFVSELADDGSAVVSVAHEALLAHWPRVQEWLEENREILRVRSRVWRGAELWETEGRRPDLLLPSGRPLEDARALIGRPDVDLGDLSRSFVETSLAKERRVKSLKRGLVAGLVLLAILAGGAAFVANRQTGIARNEALRARQALFISAARELADDSTRQVSLLREAEAKEPLGVRGWQSLSQEGLSKPLAVAVLEGHEDPVVSAAFSPGGRRIVTASRDGTARVWSADGSGKPVVLEGHEEWVQSAAFSPDGRRVVTASADKTARVWNADGSGEPVVLEGHEAWVQSAAFSPDGRRVVTASFDKTARVWNADGSGEPIVLEGHEEQVNSAAFSPDGRRIVTHSADGTARVWDPDLLALMWKRTPVCLSVEDRFELIDREPEVAEKDLQRCRRMVGCLRDGGEGAYESCYREFRRSQEAGD